MASSHTKPDFESLVEALPETADVLSTAVEILSDGGDYLQAEAILRNAIHRCPLSSLRVTLARVLMGQDRYKEAMTEMVNVLRADSENSDALLLLACCLTECGELERGGKMLQKARMAHANADEVAKAEDRWRELMAKSDSAKFADHTVPELRPEPKVELEPPKKKRAETLMGRPTGPPPARRRPPQEASGPAERASRPVPAPLESGGFSSLDTWDISADEGDIDTTVIAPDKVRLGSSGSVEPVPAVPRPNPSPPRSPAPPPRAPSASDEIAYADPDDQTSALILEDDDFAAPDDHTGHISVRDSDISLPQPDLGGVEHMPSVEYDAGFAVEAQQHAEEMRPPPADLDALPAWDSDINRYPIEDGWKEDFSAPGPYDAPDPQANQGFHQGFEQQAHQHAAHHQPPAQAPAWDSGFASAPQQRRDPTPHEVRPQGPPPGFGVPNAHVDQSYPPAEPRPRVDTAVSAEPKAPETAAQPKKKKSRLPLILVALLAIALCAFLGLTIASGMSVASSLETSVASSFEARSPDTFNGYVAAEQALSNVPKVESFMGGGFDKFVESTIPLPGLGGAKFRTEGAAELALVAAQLEYRFEKPGDRKAAERLAEAKKLAPNHAATLLAEAYVTLAQNKPAAAIALLEPNVETFKNDSRVAEGLAWANLSLARPQEATQAVEHLRKEASPTISMQYLFASIDAARGDAKAADAFAVVFAESPDHADSRIARALTLLKDKTKLTEAQKALDAVLDKLENSTSTFQKARAASAYGSFHLASGKKDQAEERFRTAIAKMPTRGELYPPLVDFLASENKSEETDALLKKAKDNSAYVPELALWEAEYRLTQSKPEVALQALDTFDYEDTRISYLEGLALYDQGNTKAAIKALEDGEKAPGDKINLQAILELNRSKLPESKGADALEKLKSTHADNAIVHWANAVVTSDAAQVTAKRGDRKDKLTAASSDVARAIELRPNWSRAHVTECEIYLLDLETEKAEKACARARELAPEFVPALVATARIFLTKGNFEEAQKLSDRALELRPEDSRVGHLAARVAIELGKLEEAKKQLERFLGKDVDAYEQALLEGRLQFARENYTRAAGYLKEAQELRPTDGEASIYYGHTLARLGEYKTAGELLKQYLSHPTWNGYAWAVLGEVRRKQSKTKDAYENLNAALRIYRKQDVPARYYSHAYTEYALTNRIKRRKWNHPSVRKMLDKGAAVGDPNDPGLNMAYGQYYLNLRKPDYAKAMTYIQKVVDVAPYRCDAVDALMSLYTRAEKEQSEIDALKELQSQNCATEKK